VGHAAVDDGDPLGEWTWRADAADHNGAAGDGEVVAMVRLWRAFQVAFWRSFVAAATDTGERRDMRHARLDAIMRAERARSEQWPPSQDGTRVWVAPSREIH
jgi:hypothetical protein